jgi:hypothetical protein
MEKTTGTIIDFIYRFFGIFTMVIDNLMGNDSIPEVIKYLLIAIYTIFFTGVMVVFFWFLKFVIELIAKGVAEVFKFFTSALADPRSIIYIASLILARSVPWYFSLLLIILVFCGIAALITGNQAWTESFKYILGATVGSLIGVVKKREEVEFEEKLFKAVGSKTFQDEAIEQEKNT